MRNYIALCSKNWFHCKCRHCKTRGKTKRDKEARKSSIRLKLKRMLFRELVE